MPFLQARHGCRHPHEIAAVDATHTAGSLAAELQQILQELGRGEAVRVE